MYVTVLGEPLLCDAAVVPAVVIPTASVVSFFLPPADRHGLLPRLVEHRS